MNYSKNTITFANYYKNKIDSGNENYFISLNEITKNNNINNIEQSFSEINTLKFSLLSNFIALLGGKIKSKQMISGNMADILSNLYLSYCVLWTHSQNHKENKDFKILHDECWLA